MSTTPTTAGNRTRTSNEGGSVPFKWVAFILGLLLPGLGHMSIGEKGRGYRILAGFLVLWFSGLLIGGLGSVRSWDPPYTNPAAGGKRNLWFIAQAAAGPIAFGFAALDASLIRGAEDDELIEITMHDRTIGTAYRFTSIGHAADFGTLFCALAGLMNFAVALDAGSSSHVADRRGGASMIHARHGPPSSQPLPGVQANWLWLLPILIFGIAMMYKAVRVGRSCGRYWREVGGMTVQVLLAFLGLATGVFIIVQWIVPLLPAG